MEDRFIQQLKKGVLEMLVLNLICKCPSYGYELLVSIKQKSNGRFALKEGTLYPILYRLEDEGFIVSQWSQGVGRTTPKKIYTPTQSGYVENERRTKQWIDFRTCVDSFILGGEKYD